MQTLLSPISSAGTAVSEAIWGTSKKWVYLTQIGFLILFVLWLGSWGKKGCCFVKACSQCSESQAGAGGVWWVWACVPLGEVLLARSHVKWQSPSDSWERLPRAGKSLMSSHKERAGAAGNGNRGMRLVLCSLSYSYCGCA